MIKSITLKGVASYKEEVKFEDLKKLNFFFGYNGSGKSTLAKYLYALGCNKVEESDYKNCSFEEFNDSNERILVFDELFIARNFIEKNTQAGVFSLDERNEDIDTLIESEEKELESNEGYINILAERSKKVSSDKAKKERDLIEKCFEYRRDFSAFTKITLEHSRNKANNLQKLKNLIDSGDLPSSQGIEKLKEQYNLLYEKELKKIEHKINWQHFEKIQKLETEINQKLDEVIIGNEDVDIAALIKELDIKKWVQDGFDILEKNKELKKCPFCQNETIDKTLREKLEGYFDTSSREKIQTIKDLYNEYFKAVKLLMSELEKIQNQYNEKNKVSNLDKQLSELLEENDKIAKEKVEKANEKKKIALIEPFRKEIEEINNAIETNNDLFDNLSTKKAEFIEQLWQYMAIECRGLIENFESRLEKYNRIENTFKVQNNFTVEKIATSKLKINELRESTVSTKTAVDNINSILRNSGFEGFEIKEKPEKVNNIAQYYLQRPNENSENVFKTLSEGEKNFISFLYYYQMCLGTEDLEEGSKKKILVIDDPVSSLDSQALFVVSSLVHSLIWRKGESPKTEKQLFKNTAIEQVFILTHNLYFYKEVSFEKRPICTNRWHFKISKLNNQTRVEGDYNKLIHDDYSLMWNTLKDIKKNLPEDKSLNIIISNSMRRVLESYVNFIGISKEAWGAVLDENKEAPEYIVKCAFISMINDESHKVSALDDVYYQKIGNEQPQILFNVFKEIFRTIGKHHYELMMDEEIEETVVEVNSSEETGAIVSEIPAPVDTESQIESQNKSEDIATSDEVKLLIKAMNGTYSKTSLRKIIGVDFKVFHSDYFLPAIDNNLITKLCKKKGKKNKAVEYGLSHEGKELKNRLN